MKEFLKPNIESEDSNEGMEKHEGFMKNIKNKVNKLTASAALSGVITGSALTFLGEAIAEGSMSKGAVGAGASILSLFGFIGSASRREEIKRNVDEKVNDVEYFEEDDGKDLINNLNLN